MTTATDASGSDRVQYNRWNEDNINVDVAASQPGLVGWELNVYEKSKSTPIQKYTSEIIRGPFLLMVGFAICWNKLEFDFERIQPNKSHISSWLTEAIVLPRWVEDWGHALYARPESTQVGGQVGRQTGKPSNHFILAEWNDWTGFTRGRRQPQISYLCFNQSSH